MYRKIVFSITWNFFGEKIHHITKYEIEQLEGAWEITGQLMTKIPSAICE